MSTRSVVATALSTCLFGASLSFDAQAQFPLDREFGAGQLSEPHDVAVFAPCGYRPHLHKPYVFVSDPDFTNYPHTQRLLQFKTDGTLVETYTKSSGNGEDFEFWGGPLGLAVDDNPGSPNFGQVYVGDSHRVRVYSIDTTWGPNYNKLKWEFDFFGNTITADYSVGIAVDGEGNVYLADSVYQVATKYPASVFNIGDATQDPWADPEVIYDPGWAHVAHDVSVDQIGRVSVLTSGPTSGQPSAIFRFDNDDGDVWTDKEDLTDYCGYGDYLFMGVDAHDPCNDLWTSISADHFKCADGQRLERRSDVDLGWLSTTGAEPVLSNPQGVELKRFWSTFGPLGGPLQTKCRHEVFVADDNWSNLPDETVAVFMEEIVSAPLPANCSAWYRFEGSATNMIVANQMGTAHGQRQGTLPRPIVGKVRCALESRNNLDWVQVLDHSAVDFGTADFSIEGWIRADRVQYAAVLDKRGPADTDASKESGYHVTVYGDNLLFQSVVEDSWRNFYGSAVITDGCWHHFAIVFDQAAPYQDGSATMKIYIDGVLDVTDTSPITGDLDNSSPLYMLRHKPGGGQGLDGALDELSFYKRSLEPSEIAAIAAAGCAGKDLPGVAHAADKFKLR